MFRDETRSARSPSVLLVALLMVLAAVPPVLLLWMQREARRPVPYLSIELGAAPDANVLPAAK